MSRSKKDSIYIEKAKKYLFGGFPKKIQSALADIDSTPIIAVAALLKDRDRLKNNINSMNAYYEDKIVRIKRDMKALKIKSREESKCIAWLIDECWELNNKPWRLFNTLIELIEKHGDKSSQNKESIHILKEYATKLGKGYRLSKLKSKRQIVCVGTLEE